ncbi:MAG: hypothetical protein K8R57_03365 [Verrucomicrobia bacterium]|nr:hypothetical protein [Verrucomicrobiota bacterium]
MPTDPLSKRPTSTISLESIRDEIQKLIAQRHWVVDKFEKDASDLVGWKDTELADNLVLLRKLGVSDQEIPFLDQKSDRRRKYQHLTHDQIKESLHDFLGDGNAPTRTILERLGISFAAFKAFAAQNPTFLQKLGNNKGRVWRISRI